MEPVISTPIHLHTDAGLIIFYLRFNQERCYNTIKWLMKQNGDDPYDITDETLRRYYKLIMPMWLGVVSE